MQNIAIVTGNAGKFRELSALVPGLTQLKLELDEIQGLDPRTVLEHKLAQAATRHDGPILVDDTSLVFGCLGGNLPGPLIKWWLGELRPQGLAELVARYHDHSATARATLGYRDAGGQNHFFVGEVPGSIVEPRGGQGFGWDEIFQPTGHAQTYAEMGETKNTLSHRFLAAQALLTHLEQTAQA